MTSNEERIIAQAMQDELGHGGRGRPIRAIYMQLAAAALKALLAAGYKITKDRRDAA